MRTFPGVLDALTYTEHLPLCIEASMRSGVYSSTSKVIMHGCASHPSIVTSKWICALSQASWTPSPTLSISLYVWRPVCTHAHNTGRCGCVHQIWLWSLWYEHVHFPRHPGRPHLHWASPFMYRGQYVLMYNSTSRCVCVHQIWLLSLWYEHVHFPRHPGHPYLHWASPFMHRGQYRLQYIWQYK